MNPSQGTAANGRRAMPSLIELFPSLTSELSRQLRLTGEVALAGQLDGALITKVIHYDADNAGVIYVQPSRKLNVVESDIVDARHDETLGVNTAYGTSIYINTAGRLGCIKILAPGDMKDALRKHAHGYVLCIEILRAIALAPDGVRFHELLDWFNLYPDTCAGAVMELLRHRFADIEDKNAPSQIRVTPEGAGFLAQRGLIATREGQFERLRSGTSGPVPTMM